MAKRSGSAAVMAAEDMIVERPSVANGGATEMTRTTLVLPVALDQNLELYAVKSGLPKGDVIKRVLIEYLTKQGFQPEKRPKSINVTY